MSRFTGMAILLAAVSWLYLDGSAADAAETPSSARYSWQEPKARVLPNGDLQWAPKAFELEKGDSVRYIDFENGDDDDGGTSKAQAWKHHPWDAKATGNAAACRGAHTYVFKRGVVYRGIIDIRESGTADNPIRLTSDPSWGKGEAMLWGSTRIAGGWKRCTKADAPPGMPEPEKVWYYDGLKLSPHQIKDSLCAFWELHGEEVIRLQLAREPNWKHVKPYDPMSQWYTFNERYHPKQREVPKGLEWALGAEGLKGREPGSLHGARMISTSGGNMGIPSFGDAPMSHTERLAKLGLIRGYTRGGLGSRFYMENLPGFLDEDSEFYIGQEALKWNHDGWKLGFAEEFSRPADPFLGRLYVRLKDGRNPNETAIEAAIRDSIIQVVNGRHIEIRGLSFRFTGWRQGSPMAGNQGAAVRLVGDCKNVEVANCRFTYLHGAIAGFTRYSREVSKRALSMFPPPETDDCHDVMDNITIRDNDIGHIDSQAIRFDDGYWVKVQEHRAGTLGHFRILRNRVRNAGFRHSGAFWSPLSTIGMSCATTAEVAGNFLDSVWGSGLFIFGGKGGQGYCSNTHIPLIRILVYHNKVTNSLLACNDWGGIETWQGGPTYVYNNISGNAVGPRFDLQYLFRQNPNLSGWQRDYICNAYAFYEDGAYKHYSFNNIAWGREWEDPAFQNRAGGMTVGNFLCPWWNNTHYNMYKGQSGYIVGTSLQAGCLFSEMDSCAIDQNDPFNVSVAGGGYSPRGEKNFTLFNSLGYTSNVFHNVKNVARVPGLKSAEYDTFEKIKKGLKEKQFMVDDLGVIEKKPVMKDPAHGDFRPLPGTAVKDRGVVHFVPWALYKTVGEWHFTRYPADPRLVIGQHWNMTDEHVSRDMYYKVPRHDLMVPRAAWSDYVPAALEDWTDGGALHFDGKSRYAQLKHIDMTADWNIGVRIERQGGKVKAVKDDKTMYPGAKRETPDIKTSSFILEAYFRTNTGHTDGTLISKCSGKGYVLDIDANGCPRARLYTDGYQQTITAQEKVNDGKWHHVLLEVDRDSKRVSLAVDGRWSVREAAPQLSGVSFSNSGDFLVGCDNNKENYFAGDFDFLRIARGSFADSKTTLEELYAWQFDGPNLRDFTGRKPADGRRDAGAIDLR